MIRLLLIFVFFGSASAESFFHPLPPEHVFQYDIRKLGLLGLVDCGPAAATETLFSLKTDFPLLKLESDVYAQTRVLAKRMETRLWANPMGQRWGTNPSNMAKGLRSYFQDSGYPKPWAYVRGFWATEAPEGQTVKEMQKPVSLEEILDYSKRGYGVILLVGLYVRLGDTKYRFGGHYLTVFGYENEEFVVTDSSRRSNVRRLRITPINKTPETKYPDHVTHMIDGSDFVYLDSAVIFIPELPHSDPEKDPGTF